MRVFLLTDCLINEKGVDIEKSPTAALKACFSGSGRRRNNTLRVIFAERKPGRARG